jgi:hypothetical protein
VRRHSSIGDDDRTVLLDQRIAAGIVWKCESLYARGVGDRGALRARELMLANVDGSPSFQRSVRGLQPDKPSVPTPCCTDFGLPAWRSATLDLVVPPLPTAGCAGGGLSGDWR